MCPERNNTTGIIYYICYVYTYTLVYIIRSAGEYITLLPRILWNSFVTVPVFAADYIKLR